MFMALSEWALVHTPDMNIPTNGITALYIGSKCVWIAVYETERRKTILTEM